MGTTPLGSKKLLKRPRAIDNSFGLAVRTLRARISIYPLVAHVAGLADGAGLPFSLARIELPTVVDGKLLGRTTQPA